MATSALPCPQQHRATYTVRPHGSAFVVVRELSGPGVQPFERQFTSEPISCPAQANDFAYRAAESFRDRYPAFLINVRPTHAWINTGTPEVRSACA